MTTYGWTGSLLRVNLSTGQITKENTMRYTEKYIGGRGMAARIAWEEIPPNIDPYDPENRLIFMTGPLSGTLAPTSGGRVEVCGVSPQAYPRPHYTRSNMGGYWGSELKYAGYDGIILEGRSEEKVYLWINDDEVEIKDASRWWGLDTYEVQALIRRTHGKEVQTVCIGPAGENLVRIAIVQHGVENAAGQGGFGAVMGSKGLKAIAVRGTGAVYIADPEGFLETCKYVEKLTHFHKDKSPEELRRQRTCTMSCTAKNCPDTFHLHKDVPGRVNQTLYTGVLQCVAPLFLKLEPWEEGFEAAQLANMYGINHWEIMLGFGGMGLWLENCKKEGMLTEEEIGMPLELERGAFWSRLLRKIAYREDIGDVFAEGLPRAADILGKGREHLPHVAHGFQTHWDGHYFGAPCYPYWLVSALMWAMDSRDPNCHGYAQEITWWWDKFGGPLTIEEIKDVGKRVYGSERAVDPESGYEYKAQPAIWHENRLSVKDSLPVCDQVFPILYSRRAEDRYGDPAAEAKLFSSATGIDLDRAGLDRVGERIFNLERAIMIREGRTREDDESVIPYFKRPDYEGVPMDVSRFRRLMDEYYDLRGWDRETGWPTREKLRELGLGDVAEALTGYVDLK